MSRKRLAPPPPVFVLIVDGRNEYYAYRRSDGRLMTHPMSRFARRYPTRKGARSAATQITNHYGEKLTATEV